MRLNGTILGIVAVLSLGLFGTAEGVEGKIKGVAFGDYYYVASGTDKNENGFRFRRIYLTYDMKWNDRWSGRVRYEANDAGFWPRGQDAAVREARLSAVPGERSGRQHGAVRHAHLERIRTNLGIPVDRKNDHGYAQDRLVRGHRGGIQGKAGWFGQGERPTDARQRGADSGRKSTTARNCTRFFT